MDQVEKVLELYALNNFSACIEATDKLLLDSSISFSEKENSFQVIFHKLQKEISFKYLKPILYKYFELLAKEKKWDSFFVYEKYFDSFNELAMLTLFAKAYLSLGYVNKLKEYILKIGTKSLEIKNTALFLSFIEENKEDLPLSLTINNLCLKAYLLSSNNELLFKELSKIINLSLNRSYLFKENESYWRDLLSNIQIQKSWSVKERLIIQRVRLFALEESFRHNSIVDARRVYKGIIRNLIKEYSLAENLKEVESITKELAIKTQHKEILNCFVLKARGVDKVVEIKKTINQQYKYQLENNPLRLEEKRLEEKFKVLFNSQRRDEAIATLKQIELINPYHPLTKVLKEMKNKEWDKDFNNLGVNLEKRVEQKVSSLVDIQKNDENLSFERNTYKAAEVLYEGESFSFYKNLYQTFFDLDFLDAAMKVVQKLYKSCSSMKEINEVKYLEIELLLRQKKFRDALKTVRELFENKENEIENYQAFLYLEAEALFNIGQFENAKSIYLSIYKNNADYRLTKQRLETIG